MIKSINDWKKTSIESTFNSDLFVVTALSDSDAIFRLDCKQMFQTLQVWQRQKDLARNLLTTVHVWFTCVCACVCVRILEPVVINNQSKQSIVFGEDDKSKEVAMNLLRKNNKKQSLFPRPPPVSWFCMFLFRFLVSCALVIDRFFFIPSAGRDCRQIAITSSTVCFFHSGWFSEQKDQTGVRRHVEYLQTGQKAQVVGGRRHFGARRTSVSLEKPQRTRVSLENVINTLVILVLVTVTPFVKTERTESMEPYRSPRTLRKEIWFESMAKNAESKTLSTIWIMSQVDAFTLVLIFLKRIRMHLFRNENYKTFSPIDLRLFLSCERWILFALKF